MKGVQRLPTDSSVVRAHEIIAWATWRYELRLERDSDGTGKYRTMRSTSEERLFKRRAPHRPASAAGGG
eukprot:9445701-Pyramimonas_sp.AAC.1